MPLGAPLDVEGAHRGLEALDPRRRAALPLPLRLELMLRFLELFLELLGEEVNVWPRCLGEADGAAHAHRALAELERRAALLCVGHVGGEADEQVDLCVQQALAQQPRELRIAEGNVRGRRGGVAHPRRASAAIARGAGFLGAHAVLRTRERVDDRAQREEGRVNCSRLVEDDAFGA